MSEQNHLTVTIDPVNGRDFNKIGSLLENLMQRSEVTPVFLLWQFKISAGNKRVESPELSTTSYWRLHDGDGWPNHLYNKLTTPSGEKGHGMFVSWTLWPWIVAAVSKDKNEPSSSSVISLLSLIKQVPTKQSRSWWSDGPQSYLHSALLH